MAYLDSTGLTRIYDKMKTLFAATVHTHVIENVTDLTDVLANHWTAISGKAPTVHTHDDRYYTETEINTSLSGKLGSTATAADSDKLDGKHASEFATSAQGTLATNALPKTSNAVSATKLNSIQTTFNGVYPMTVNVGGVIYSHTGINYTGSTSSLVVNGNVTAYSDIRVKENLEIIPNALDKVKAINGYTFDRTDMKVPRQTGVIAQELLEVLPEAVVTDEKGMYSVAYGNVVGLLIEAIKEQQIQIDNQQKQIDYILAQLGNR
ncbi:tail fiber domain-containing protein [Clostridium sp.]|uniref:tail fiber domain-containing protein n=1 Tax=Clostridium sp. TaxID=1506 RepID=UPI001A42E32F|nr:tail fiber domain-containing protein [Clostridium sp.]MBK5234059.1 tail fiber domain-containing protein [Clostridium sp.]